MKNINNFIIAALLFSVAYLCTGAFTLVAEFENQPMESEIVDAMRTAGLVLPAMLGMGFTYLSAPVGFIVSRVLELFTSNFVYSDILPLMNSATVVGVYAIILFGIQKYKQVREGIHAK